MYETWYLNGTYEKMIEEMINTSTINTICFAIWVIPLLVLIVQELMFNHKEAQTIIKS